MSDAGADTSAQQTVERIDRNLLAESKLYEVPYRAYVEMSVRERSSLKARWAKKMRTEAERRGIDPDEFLAMDEDARNEARASNPEREKPPPRTRTVRSLSEEPPEREERAPRAARAPVADLYDEGLAEGDPHSPMDSVPATEDDPKMRTHATLGEVRPLDNEDLVGWQNPKNLRDVYARYTVGDGQHFIRVERVDPKVWQQIPCAGYLGDIREPITESEFHAFYGGRVYALTVYGPDPRGRKDPSTGLPVIKAKTDPFRYTVPVFPPNLAVLPGTSPRKQGDTTMTQQHHPFMMGPMGPMPTTPADANMFKTSIDFMSDQLKRGDKEREELRAQVMNGGGSREVIAAVTETTKATIDAQSRASEAREAALRDQLAQEREERRRLELKIDKMAESQQQNGRGGVQDAMTIVDRLNPAKTAEEQVTRMRDGHKEEMDRLRESHKEAISALKERHDDELKRSRERLQDVEAQSRTKLDDLERRGREREKELRDQMDQLRRDEREAADRRVKETVDRFEDRMKDLKSQQERELRMQESQHVTRVDTTKGTWDMQLANAKERIARLEEELAEAKEEAEASKDPVQVMEKAKASAEALGFKKDENEPQGAWERFAATAGMGLSKALESVDQWLPKALEAGRGAAAQQPPAGTPGRMLPNGMNPTPPPRPAPRPAPRRQVAWATQGGIPVAGQHPVMPPDVVTPAQQPVQAQNVPMAQPSAPPQQPMTAPPVEAQTAASEPAPQQPSNGQPPNALYGAVFPDDIIVQFRTEVERAINSGMPSESFADRFVTAFYEPSAMLVQAHKPDEFIEIIKKMPNGASSVILRRDGKRWVEKLWDDIVQKHRTQAQQAQQPSAPS